MDAPTISFYFGENQINLNFPSGFRLFGWTFHLYGAIIAIGFILAALYALKRRKYFGIHDDSVFDMLFFGVPFGVIGARAYYLIFSERDWSGSFTDNLLDSLKIWNGGLAIYGGIIGAVIGIILFGVYQRRKNKKDGKTFKLAPYLDLVALGFLIGQAVGRWGNFTNRECYGSVTTLPWRMGLTIDGVTR
ncbi:MAG: prolipoprotein diacylglyceryl transferase, partial [Oscillospiraceae bacterium]|nr:prolipoprotein diacylglyceryl transferase [Oscillospiraceae bacterium]